MISRVTILLIDKKISTNLEWLDFYSTIIQPNILVFIIICYFGGFTLWLLKIFKFKINNCHLEYCVLWAVVAGICWRALRSSECQVWAGAEEAGAREWEAPMSGSQLARERKQTPGWGGQTVTTSQPTLALCRHTTGNRRTLGYCDDSARLWCRIFRNGFFKIL